jgi:hypothetical protein
MLSWHQPRLEGARVSQVVPVLGGKYSPWALPTRPTKMKEMSSTSLFIADESITKLPLTIQNPNGLMGICSKHQKSGLHSEKIILSKSEFHQNPASN